MYSIPEDIKIIIKSERTKKEGKKKTRESTPLFLAGNCSVENDE